ncbi:Myb-like DNA-binding domain containing protein [Trichomonas vaginalis G3]|uniref:Myb-like DNA-binding domain containing protein n=1 Tax=Trichomonas vaginalis (strain ATCC PRA-98 / G3) TaxID=412133 RepID=A2D7C2_TRIV3|nr:RNA polymerase II transcription regulator recruiting protein [Trichomonas vaginalis G3]EAY23639.1 Myb-like DNA-binding domain containing protein [Trichomonas vaginalis G3]KAI5490131.1 RNA polymerase II transcription regulator recruiting protein [Trichomonas vaginalis G3]|eukprot:XP_001276887.1 Myb-like DNA-binding domain containing protein [Trichomonas vaginalis G3]
MHSVRTFFKPSEDALIIKWRKKRPDAPWSEIAKKIKGKTAKQCNDRYNKHLKNVRNEKEWTADEDKTLEELVNKHGHNWVLIASVLGNRTNNEAKNRWCVLTRNMNKKVKLPEKPSLEIEKTDDFSVLFDKQIIAKEVQDIWSVFDQDVHDPQFEIDNLFQILL